MPARRLEKQLNFMWESILIASTITLILRAILLLKKDNCLMWECNEYSVCVFGETRDVCSQPELINYMGCLSQGHDST